MGMLFGGWAREEEEEWKYENEKTGVSFEDWKAHKEAKYNNCNLSYYKRIGRFKGIDLSENDIICNDISGDKYLINDFMENGRPICTLISNEKHNFYKKPYPFDKLFIIRSILGDYKES